MKNKWRSQQGFNLIELIVVIAIAAILMGLAAPSFTTMLERRAIQAEANRLVKSINLARSKAVTSGEGLNVTIEHTSATDKNWSTGWLVFVDDDGNIANAYDGNNDELLADMSPDTRTLSVLSDIDDRIMFNAQGRLTNGPANFAVCDTAFSTDIDGSLITIALTGRATISTIPAATKTAANCTP